MRLARLDLLAYGPFTNRVLDLGPAGRLVLLYGPNEAGKSSALRALSDLRFGIPQQSRDNFVHPHPQMRVGGAFVDAEGRVHEVVRRKGRGATLLATDTGEPVSPELEARITCGLSREEHDTAFGIDHARLRQGGEALLDGHGELGAALFEASAGVRGIDGVLRQLDADARQRFIPGVRARNAQINEGLRAYREHQEALRELRVRPGDWGRLARQHHDAAATLEALELQRARLHARLLLIGELRAVAPLLATLRHAGAVLHSLGEAALLPESAERERSQAQAALGAARQELEFAEAEADGHQRRLEAIEVDEALLEAAPLLRRLAAAVQAAEHSSTELADAQALADARGAALAALAARIDADAPGAAVLARVPAPSARADIDLRLRRFEQACRALAEHRESARQELGQSPQEPCDELPPPQARSALQLALAQLVRDEATLARLAALPQELDEARRSFADALAALGSVDAASLPALRPLPDADIDEAAAQDRRDIERIEEREAADERLAAAIAVAQQQRLDLLAQGTVPTQDEVHAARQRRDAGWRRLRAAGIDSPPADTAAAAALAPLADAFELELLAADRLADALALDSTRAAQLQACARRLAELDREREALRAEREELSAAQARRRAAWAQSLRAARLPEMTPAALREWQAMLAHARAARETLCALQDELQRTDARARELAAALRSALCAAGAPAPAPDAPLGLLVELARQMEADLGGRETAYIAAQARRKEAERRRAQLQSREAHLDAERQAAREALAPVLAALALGPQAGVEVIRARLDELDELARLEVQRDDAQQRAMRSRAVLDALEADARAIAGRLGRDWDGDARLFVDQGIARLEQAERARSERALALQAHARALEAQRKHAQAVSLQEQRLAQLCAAAGVATADALPEAEERSRRRREAQTTIDRVGAQLAQASRRSADELRELLADRDAASLDAEEAALAHEQTQLDAALRDARAQEEGARHALQAIDGADAAAAAAEASERALAAVRAAIAPWARARLAHALLSEALARFRERAEAPMLRAASAHFARITGGAFVRLASDDSGELPVLVAERAGGALLRIEAMSEGTLDQLYLALRLAALGLRRSAGVDLPLVLDDVLMTSDDRRAGLALAALAEVARDGQVLVFTHHRHLVEIAQASVAAQALSIVELEPE